MDHHLVGRADAGRDEDRSAHPVMRPVGHDEARRGAKIIAVAEYDGAIYDPNGIDIQKLNNNIVEDEKNNISMFDFNENQILKVSHGKKQHVIMKIN